MPWCREFNGEGPLFLFGHFLQTEECTTEELCGPYLWAGNQGHMGWPRRVCFPMSHVGPHVLSPLQAVGSQTRGQGAEIQAG